MNRTLGFFLGSGVVFALLILVLGRPVPLAPPVDRDLDWSAGTATVPVAIPTPPTQPEATPSQQLAPAPPTHSELPLAPKPPAQANAATESALAPTPEPIAAAVVVEQVDENALIETWMASREELPMVDLTVGPDNVSVSTDDAAETASLDVVIEPGPAAEPEAELAWFPLWDPFHSELSANAFARRLERITGLDYRVIKTGSTQYRVAMGYTSEEQRLANVAMIEEATGLNITGGMR